MITKELIGEMITVTPEGWLEYKRIEAIMENGIELARQNWRTTYNPLTDVREFPESSRLRRVMEAVFTPTLKEEWRQRVAKEKENAGDGNIGSEANDKETVAPSPPVAEET